MEFFPKLVAADPVPMQPNLPAQPPFQVPAYKHYSTEESMKASMHPDTAAELFQQYAGDGYDQLLGVADRHIVDTKCMKADRKEWADHKQKRDVAHDLSVDLDSTPTKYEKNEGILKGLRQKRADEVGALPIIARSHEKQEHAQLMRRLVDSSFFPIDVLGSKEKDDKKKESPVSSFISEKSDKIEGSVRNNGWTGEAYNKYSQKYGHGAKTTPGDDRAYINSLRKTPDGAFTDQLLHFTANTIGSIATLGGLPVAQSMAKLKNEQEHKQKAVSMSGDREQSDLVRNLAAGRASGNTANVASSSVGTMTRVGLNLATAGTVDVVGDAASGMVEMVTDKVIDVAEGAGKAALGAGGRLLAETGVGAGTGIAIESPDKETVQKAARRPAIHPKDGPADIEQKNLIADLNLLHYVGMDADASGAVIDELGKPDLSWGQMTSLGKHFPDPNTIIRPETARQGLRLELGGNLPTEDEKKGHWNSVNFHKKHEKKPAPRKISAVGQQGDKSPPPWNPKTGIVSERRRNTMKTVREAQRWAPPVTVQKARVTDAIKKGPGVTGINMVDELEKLDRPTGVELAPRKVKADFF